MAEILHQFIGRLSHYFEGFIHPRWLFGISAINSSSFMCIFHTQPDPSKSGDDSIGLTRTVFLRVVFITKDPDFRHLEMLLRLEVQEQFFFAVFAMDILEVFGSMK